MRFEQNNKNIFLYHIISPVVLLVDILILIFNRNQDSIIFVIGLTSLNLIMNLHDVIRTHSYITITDKLIRVNYTFFKGRSKTISRRNITNIYKNDKTYISLQAYLNLEIKYIENKNVKTFYLYKGFMTYEDFDKIKSLLKLN